MLSAGGVLEYPVTVAILVFASGGFARHDIDVRWAASVIPVLLPQDIGSTLSNHDISASYGVGLRNRVFQPWVLRLSWRAAARTRTARNSTSAHLRRRSNTGSERYERCAIRRALPPNAASAIADDGRDDQRKRPQVVRGGVDECIVNDPRNHHGRHRRANDD